MIDEAGFAELGLHLEEVRPIFDEFCAAHRFAYVSRRSVGRYPRIRVERAGVTNIWFDLSMELDQDGHRFERFRRDLPYTLSAGAYFDVPDGSKYGTRFGKCFRCFAGKPFDQVAAILHKEMEKHLSTLEGWDEQYLMESGEKLKLGGGRR